MKIHIIGPSGSGKSTFAAALSEKLDIPHYDLDELMWDNSGSYGVKRDTAQRAKMLADILKKQDWIIEGVYYAWVGQCFSDADRIYLMDIPPRVYKARIIRRHISRRLGIEHGKRETLRSLIALLKWTDRFQRENMAEIRKILADCRDKTVVLKSAGEVRKEICTYIN